MKKIGAYLTPDKVGEKIRQARKICGFTQKDLAVAAGVSVNTVSAWENGLYFPSISSLLAVSRECDISWEWFLF